MMIAFYSHDYQFLSIRSIFSIVLILTILLYFFIYLYYLIIFFKCAGRIFNMFNFESIVLFIFLISILLFIIYFDFPYLFNKSRTKKDIIVPHSAENQVSDIDLPTGVFDSKNVFYRKKNISFPDVEYYKPLYDLLGGNYYILYKTYFFDVFDCISSLNGNEISFTPHNPLFYYYFDFVIVRKSDSLIVCAIELNESLFKDKGNISKDNDFYKALRDANIYFIRANSTVYLIEKIKVMLSRFN
ncbi:DUF2726 domain-containing protein [Salmonella enterica]|nr:DUF2726 domain-containing protein [Salmonella enterica]EDT7594680.1 DUF2726 domain-containing protein [Salmonella enterica subsp. enterica serovar Bovismorbificans]